MPEAEPSSSAHSYEVLGKLAEGGLTEIFLARAKGAGAVERFVVLKRLKRAVASQVDLIKLFLDEARLTSQLQHPNIAQVFEVGKLGGSYFFAMEFVNGETLQSLMLHARTKKIQVPVRAVLTIAAAMAAGLHHAHDRKGTDGQALAIVHGEVSPTNTLVSQEGIVKLVDFGVARAGEHGSPKIGPYASPEQCNGGPLDRRSDMFSLGVVLWELLTLDSLFHRATDDEVKTAIETEEPTKPSAKRYDVPPELDAMVLKLLAKNPADRFPDADELLGEIEALAQKLSILLSTADLSRMMRLWFGTKSEPAEEASEPVTPLVVESEEIPDDLAVPVESPIDDQLDAVRSAAALITARATARSGSTTGRQDKPSVPPELMDHPNENFEQIRDRILARARQKKETARNQIVGAAPLATDPTPAAAEAGPPGVNGVVPGSPTTAASAASPSDRHTRNTAQAPIAVIEQALRMSGNAEPAATKPAPTNGANGRHADTSDSRGTGSGDEPYTPDKVVVDEEIRGSHSVSGELGGQSSATSGASDDRRGAKLEAAKAYAEAAAKADVAGTIVSGREAPPASANLTSTSSRTGTAANAPDAGGNATSTRDAKATAHARATDDADDATDRDGSAGSAHDSARRRDRGSADRDSSAHDSARRRDRGAAGADGSADSEHDSAGRRNRDAERDDDDAADRVHREEVAYARASTAEILRRPPRRPAWIVPVLGGAVLVVLILIVTVLRSGEDQPSRAHAKSDQPAAPSSAGTQPALGSAAVPSTLPAAPSAPQVVATAPADAAAAVIAAGSGAAEVVAQAGSGATANQAAAGTDTGAKAEPANEADSDSSEASGTKTEQVANAEPVEKPATKQDRAKQDRAKQDRSNEDRGGNDAASKRDAGDKKKSIEELYAAGDFASTNTACTKEIVFTAEKLEVCATAACETRNAALAKRWIRAIRAAARPPLVEKCRANGVEVEASAPAPATPPAAPAPDPAP